MLFTPEVQRPTLTAARCPRAGYGAKQRRDADRVTAAELMFTPILFFMRVPACHDDADILEVAHAEKDTRAR